jgi:hypothetical protein
MRGAENADTFVSREGKRKEWMSIRYPIASEVSEARISAMEDTKKVIRKSRLLSA